MKKISMKKIGILIRNNYSINRSLPMILFIGILAISCIVGALPVSSVESNYSYRIAMNYDLYESYTYSMKRVYEDLTGISGAFSFLFIMTAALLPFFSSLSLNGFMRDKSGNDFYHSLAVNRKEMFIANYITTLINTSVTVIVSQLGGILLMDMMVKYKPMSLGKLFVAQLPIIGIALMYVALFTAIAMIATTAAGTVFSSLVNYLSVNFLIPATILAVAVSGMQLFDSKLMDYLGHFPQIFAYTSPFIRAVFGFNDMMDYTALSCILHVVATLLLVLLGIFIYAAKKNENSFKPLPYTHMVRPLQYIITFDAILLGGTFFEAITGSMAWCIAGILLTLFFSFIAFNAFVNKSFNGVLKNARHMAFILVITIALGTVFVADAFKMYKEPQMDPQQIESAYINVSYSFDDRDEYYSFDFVEEINDGYEYGIEVDDEAREDINKLWELIKNCEGHEHSYDDSKQSLSISMGVGCKNDFSRYHQYHYMEENCENWDEIKEMIEYLTKKYKSHNNVYYHETEVEAQTKYEYDEEI